MSKKRKPPVTPRMPIRDTSASEFVGLRGGGRQGIASNVGPSLASAAKGTPMAPVGGPATQLPLTRRVNTILRQMGVPRGYDKKK